MKSTTLSIVIAAAVAAAVVLGAASAEQTSTTPRLGTGSVRVEGDVSVKVVNDVNARQSGPWNVGVNGIVNTSPQALPFVRVGRSYVVQWADRSVQTIIPRETSGSWARVDSGGQSQAYWINLAAALTIEER